KIATSLKKVRKEQYDIKGKKRKRYKKAEMFKYVDSEFPSDAAIFRDKVIFFDLGKKVPTAILISGKYLSSTYKDFFIHIWKKEKKL
ncbi:hypothetical protein ACFL1H_08075, partial [Nanoarchaeota archaeon]